MIAMVHIPAFHAAIEQRDNADLQKQPVVVITGGRIATVMSVAPEAYALGVRLGMTWADALARCPSCTSVIARQEHYADVSKQISHALQDVTPEIEVQAVDVAFIDLTSCQSYYRHDPHAIALLIQKQVYTAARLPCTIGISGDKTTARWAALQGENNGRTVIAPEYSADYLQSVRLTDLCGISSGVADFFNDLEVRSCGDMKKIPVSVPAQRLGHFGKTLWLMAQGRDPSPVVPDQHMHFARGLSKTLPPDTSDPVTVLSFFRSLAVKLASQLQRQGLVTHEIQLAMRCREGWRQACWRSAEGINDEASFIKLIKRFLHRHWHGESVLQIRMHAPPSSPLVRQSDFFN
jgi:DNA polymerase-4